MMRRVLGIALALLVAGFGALTGWNLWARLDAVALTQVEHAPPGAAATVLERSIAASLAASNYQLTPEVIGLARQLADAAPLSPKPLAILSDQLQQAGDWAGAMRLMRLAAARNKRLVPLQASLVQDAFSRGDLKDVAVRILMIDRVDPAWRSFVLAYLQSLSQTPEGRALIEAAWTEIDPAKTPGWKDLFAIEVAKTHPDLAFARRAAIAAPIAQKPFVVRILEADGAAAAREAWRGFLPKAQQAEAETQAIYDGAFARQPGPEPFNWRLDPKIAAYEPGGGLDVRYEGRAPTDIAEQWAELAPGSYQLVSKARVRARLKGGGLAWRIVCRATGSVLTELKLANTTWEDAEMSAAFAAPEGCGSVAVRLVGVPSEFTYDAQALVANIRIEPQPLGTGPVAPQPPHQGEAAP